MSGGLRNIVAQCGKMVFYRTSAINKKIVARDFLFYLLFRFTKVLSEACEHAAEMSKVLAINRRRTVNATLKLYAGYTDEEHDMLHKRVFKQLELDNAKKNFEKAKPPKKQQVSNL